MVLWLWDFHSPGMHWLLRREMIVNVRDRVLIARKLRISQGGSRSEEVELKAGYPVAGILHGHLHTHGASCLDQLGGPDFSPHVLIR